MEGESVKPEQVCIGATRTCIAEAMEPLISSTHEMLTRKRVKKNI